MQISRTNVGLFQHADWVYRGNLNGVRRINKTNDSKKAVTKRRESAYDIDSHSITFLNHIYIPDLGSLEYILGTLYFYSNSFLFFFFFLSIWAFYIFKSLFYSQWKWIFRRLLIHTVYGIFYCVTLAKLKHFSHFILCIVSS